MTRRAAVAGLLFGAIIAVAHALPPLQPPALSIDVKQENIDRSHVRWRTDWGSIGKDYLQRRVLLVTLRAVGDFDRRVVMEWYFVGKHEFGLGVYGAGAAACVARGADAKPYVVASENISSFRDRYNALGLTESGGMKPWGWVVLVWQGDRLIKVQSSTHELGRDFADGLRDKGAPDPDLR